jgi:hypothetical protein
MIAARTTRALLVDVWGAAYYVYPERGYYYLDLPGANCAQGCQMGGAPFMLVEDASLNADTAPPPSSPTVPPVENTTPDVTPDPDASPTPTPDPNTPTPTPTNTPTPTDAPTPTSTPTNTPTNTPTSTPTNTPTSTPTPVPLPRSDVPLSRPWLIVGVLVAAIGTTALVTNHRGHTRATRD